MKKISKFLNLFPQIKGRVWVDLWGIVALVRFASGHSVDPIYLGVLGIYGGTTIAKAITAKTGDDSNA